jgi:hypothetical protein
MNEAFEEFEKFIAGEDYSENHNITQRERQIAFYFWENAWNHQQAKIDAQAEEIIRLIKCLKKANDHAEEFERKYYLEQQEKEAQSEELKALRGFTEFVINKADEGISIGSPLN